MERRYNARSSASGGRNAMRDGRGTYVNGNAVRKTQHEDERRRRRENYERMQRRRMQEERAQLRSQDAHQISMDVQKNREKVAGINRGFVVFLTVILMLIMGFSIHFLQLKSELISSRNRVNGLERELTDLRQENDAYYSQVTNGVDQTEFRKIATERLGMKPATDDQIISYHTEKSTHVRQYQDMPN